MGNKTVLITGAAKGIGKAIAKEFAKNGYDVGINYNKSHSEALKFKNELISMGIHAEVFQGDVSNPNDCNKISSDFIKCFNNIDVLINNAGISKISPINDLKIEDWNSIINTNLSSAFYMTSALLPYFIKNKSGSIINISSIWGVSGASCEVAYSASKAGLIGYTQALAKELGPSGIRVNSVSPGVIDTDMNRELCRETLNELSESTALCRIGKPEEIAKTVIFLSSDNSAFITGQNIIVDGGYL